METFIKSYIKKIATDFFYYWWNTPGNNTDQGFDEWWAKHAKDYPVEIPEITDEEIQKYVNSFPDNPNHLLFDATINSTFVDGAKWYREELKKRLK